MKLVKLSKVNETLEILENEYDKLRGLIADQVNDNQIGEAQENFKKLLGLKESIEQMGNLYVQV